MNRKQVTLSIPWPDLRSVWAFARKWLLPNPGTLVLVVILALTVPAIAGSRTMQQSTSTSTVSYQGRLADAAGNPITDYKSMVFRIYDVPDGGMPLWEEAWTGANSVSVSDGLFSVMLGSINQNLAAAIAGHSELYLGIEVGADAEMVPRVQLGSVPFSMQAMTVPDSSITEAKISNGAVTTDKMADGAVTQAKAPFALAGPGSGYRIEVGTGPIDTYTDLGMQPQKAISFSQPFTSPPRVYIQVRDSDWGTGVFTTIVAVTNSTFQYRDYVVDMFGNPSVSVTHFWIAIGN